MPLLDQFVAKRVVRYVESKKVRVIAEAATLTLILE